MTILSDYGTILQVLKFCGKMITSLPWCFTSENLYSKLFWGRTFSVVNRFSNFLQHFFAVHFRTNLRVPDSAKKIVCLQLNEIEDIQGNTIIRG